MKQAKALDGPARRGRHPHGTRETAKAKLAATLDQFDIKIDTALAKWRLDAREVNYMLGLRGQLRKPINLLASNRQIRFKLGCAFIDRMVDMFEAHPDRRFFFITLIHDGWRTWDRGTAINLADVQSRGYQMLKIIGLPAHAVIEIQAAVNARAGKGRELLPHVHAIGWTDDPAFSAKQAMKNANGSTRLVSMNGADPVDIVEVGRTIGDLAHTAGYLFKAPYEGKDFAPPKDGAKRGRVFSRSSSVRPNLIFRLFEALSQMTFGQMMFSYGRGPQGVGMRQLVARIEAQLSAKIDYAAKTAKFWKSVRKKNGKSSYKSIRYRFPGMRNFPSDGSDAVSSS